ncbi:FecR domain-containing protein [Thalassococcus sp. S3]|uniref:FecR family protein n=1 Tax=Thalassococcus sp. S3 TaxID=2017482 RepID=UPI001024907A|nr:FecR family protein [Thalassococcus sp. S3]QBF33231.1 hypothetical protein CFI11_18665 [Thalassococcus sp. S3]
MQRLSLILASVTVGLFFALPVFANQIGVVASISPALRGTPPGASERILGQGQGVVQDEVIQSSDAGRAQLLFLDETTLSIAPSSRVVLDAFVYDPNRTTGQLGLQLTRGALRMIGGNAMRGGEAVVRTPSATIGIRGSSAIVIYSGGRTTAIFLMGDRMCLTRNGRRTCTNRSGGVLTDDGYLGKVSQGYLADVLTWIDGPAPSSLARRETAPESRTRTDGPKISTTGQIADTGLLDTRRRVDIDIGSFFEEGLPDEPVEEPIVNPETPTTEERYEKYEDIFLE